MVTTRWEDRQFIRRLGAVLRKTIFDIYAAMASYGTLLAWLLERVVVRVERCRVVGAAPWSEFLGGSEQRFNGLVSENNQGGYRLEACWPGLIATYRADALHDLLAAELL